VASTVIGSTITIEGEISGDEALVVQGAIKGRIAVSEAVFVENSASVEADVEAEEVEIGGVLTGNVSARARVEIKAEGKMVGDIKSPRILIADGALFKGNIDMDVER
jgi:cytoskeletal protein CcmA (bactofilin family)